MTQLFSAVLEELMGNIFSKGVHLNVKVFIL